MWLIFFQNSKKQNFSHGKQIAYRATSEVTSYTFENEDVAIKSFIVTNLPEGTFPILIFQLQIRLLQKKKKRFPKFRYYHQ